MLKQPLKKVEVIKKSKLQKTIVPPPRPPRKLLAEAARIGDMPRHAAPAPAGPSGVLVPAAMAPPLASASLPALLAPLGSHTPGAARAGRLPGRGCSCTSISSLPRPIAASASASALGVGGGYAPPWCAAGKTRSRRMVEDREWFASAVLGKPPLPAVGGGAMFGAAQPASSDATQW